MNIKGELYMGANKELRKIQAELEQVKSILRNVKTNRYLSNDEAESYLVNLIPALRNIKDRFDKIDRIWANGTLVNDIDSSLIEILGRYNEEEPESSVRGLYQDVKEDIARRFASEGIRSRMNNIEKTLNSLDTEARGIESRNVGLSSYINNENNGRREARIVRVATKAGALLGIAGLGGAVFTLVYQNDKYKDLNSQLKAEYSIVGEQLKDAQDANAQWENKYNVDIKEWQDKYNEALQNSGSGVSKEEYDKLKQENEEWKKKYNNLMAEYSNILAEYSAIMDVIPSGSNAIAYINGLVDNIESLTSQIDALEARIAALEASKTTLTTRIGELEALLDAALKDNKDQELINTLKKQIEEANTRYAELQTAYNNDIKAKNAKIAQCESEITTLKGALNAEVEKNKGLQEENADLKAAVQVVSDVYSQIYPNGKETDVVNKFNAILAYYGNNSNSSSLAREFIVRFVAEVKGVPYSQIAALSDEELVAIAGGLVGLPAGPSQNPENGNVHEQGSANNNSNGGGVVEEPKNDGTQNPGPGEMPSLRE